MDIRGTSSLTFSPTQNFQPNMSTFPFVVRKTSPSYWQATIDNPPFNLLGPEFFEGLWNLLNDAETSPDLKVLVFDSAVPDFFISHYDLQRAAEIPPEHMARWPRMMLKLATLPAVTVASIRGRARGAGSEFALACDVQFGSREKAILSQVEVSLGLLPGGGGIEWLSRKVGRNRLVEIVCGSDEFDAETAAQYGWINRAIPDADFEQFVDGFARRVAGWDGTALAEAKRLMNKRLELPQEPDFVEAVQAMQGLWANPATQKRMTDMFARGLESDRDVELNLGKFTAEFPAPTSSTQG